MQKMINERVLSALLFLASGQLRCNNIRTKLSHPRALINIPRTLGAQLSARCQRRERGVMRGASKHKHDVSDRSHRIRTPFATMEPRDRRRMTKKILNFPLTRQDTSTREEGTRPSNLRLIRARINQGDNSAHIIVCGGVVVDIVLD